MINGLQVKICGLTLLADAGFAADCGADYLGFILYPKSPRHLPLESFKAMVPHLPARKKVAVSVLPTPGELAGQRAAGFDFFQVHFPVDEGPANVPRWAAAVGSDRLWLAPKLRPGTELATELISQADAIVWDAHAPGIFGGTGRASDWVRFKRHQEEHAGKKWILAGGLAPGNIVAAVRATGARFVDVNSGVEASPGVKDHAKLRALVRALGGG